MTKDFFNRELQISKLPYKDLADEETLKFWFEQVNKAPRKLSFPLYRLKYYPDKEYKLLLKQDRKKLYDLEEKFNELKDNQKYLIGDIEKTEIANSLKNIETLRIEFLNTIFDNSTYTDIEPQKAVDRILSEIKSLPTSFADAIINEIKNGDVTKLVFNIDNPKLDKSQKSKLNSRIRTFNELLSKDYEQQPHQSQFSVLEWATIFFYADITKLLPENKIKKIRMEQFMNTHGIKTTFDNFKSKYHEAEKRINRKNDYPIAKLESILPFLKEHYNKTVNKVENDITIIETEMTDY